MQEIILVSFYMPSGVSWLMNFLLELDIRLETAIVAGTPVWKREPVTGAYKLDDAHTGLKQWLPILTRKDSFDFAQDICVRQTHELPDTENTTKKIILVVRDGRSVLYSQFKKLSDVRQKDKANKSYEFPEMMESLGNRHSLLMPPAELWALYNHLWVNAVKQENLLLVRFEDIKSAPLKVARDVADFVGKPVSEEDIELAIENSSQEKAKKAEEDFIKNDSRSARFPQYVINRKGSTNEWSEKLSEAELAYFKGFPEQVLSELGYGPDPENRNGEAMLTEYGLKSGAIRDGWLGRNYNDLRLRLAKADAKEMDAILIELIAYEWLRIIFRHDRRRCNKQEVYPIYLLLADAIKAMGKKQFLSLWKAKASFSAGRRRAGMQYLDMITRDPSATREEHIEAGKLYFLNLNFLSARASLAAAGIRNWIRYGIAEYIKFVKKEIKYRLV